MDQRVARELRVLPDIAAAARALADEIGTAAELALRLQGQFSLVIPGGSTPKWLFAELRRHDRHPIDWSKVDLFWSDERCVPPDDPRSNFALAREFLLPLPGLTESGIHRIQGELPMLEAAEEYQHEIAAFRNRATSGPRVDLFDFAVVGMGPDGHTASLFPGSPTLRVRDRWVTVEPSPSREPRVARITLTLGALDRTRTVAFLAEGTDKATAVATVFHPSVGVPELPAGQVNGTDRTLWFLDPTAAQLVEPQT